MSTEPQREDAKTTRHLPPHLSSGSENHSQNLDTPALYSRINLERGESFNNLNHNFGDEYSDGVYSNHVPSNTKSGPKKFNGAVRPTIDSGVSSSWPIVSTSQMTKNILQPTSFSAFGLLGSVCQSDRDCSVTFSLCKERICYCRNGFTGSTSRHSCVGKLLVSPIVT